MAAIQQVFGSVDLLNEIQCHLNNTDFRTMILLNRGVKALLWTAIRDRHREYLCGEPFRSLRRFDYIHEIWQYVSYNCETAYQSFDIIEHGGKRYKVTEAPRSYCSDPYILESLDDGTLTLCPNMDACGVTAEAYRELSTHDREEQYSWAFNSEGVWRFHNESRLIESYLGTRLVQSFTERDPSNEVWYEDWAIAFQQELADAVSALAASKSPDWHPGSNDMVNDLVHPALYAYQHNHPADTTMTDFWGREYEPSVHQWLPSEIDVAADGSVRFASYINNMPQGQDGLISLLERLLQTMVPYWEHAWQYARMYRTEFGWGTEPTIPKKLSFRRRRLQVIPKIVEFVFQPGQTYEGVWHYEGMSHENIVATGLYYVRRDAGIEGGDLEFKRCFSDEEAYKFRMGTPQQRPRVVNELAQDFVPLGRLATDEGRLVVFVNCHAHRILQMTNTSNEVQKRQFVCFFLVNPDVRILSTQDVKPQQGVVSHEEALRRRLQLLQERKFYKQTLNPRLVSLCEH
eukprot:TRINITY_DN13878_c0_g1_i1.p1 TRINITY_DN13878_c0_g1~~TRINITY_DN13878_c0_g1_i1.p1  ORF type:complete len:542 (+),score=72.81 TRINITY_DN13878_c0_g1_i1:79-1626(+)